MTERNRGEVFSPPLRLPRWALFVIVGITSPLLLVIFLSLDDPLMPSPAHEALNTTYQFSARDTPPLEGWKPIADFDPSEHQQDGALVSTWQTFEVSRNFTDRQLAIFIPVLFGNYRVY